MIDKGGDRIWQRNEGKERVRGVSYYATILFVITGLVVLAFFTPQFIFQVQDAVLCKDTVLSRQESMNVEALSTTYEQSLAVRMLNFAEGLAEDDTFYVTCQNLTVSDEVDNYLYSQEGLYSETISSFINGNMLPVGLWEMEFAVTQWKRYVIYSDNFTKGVNFILWYIEMENPEGIFFKMLVDAEDKTIYAIKTEGNEAHAGEYEKWENYDYLDRILWSDGAAMDLWGYFAMYYEALSDEEKKLFYTLEEQFGYEIDDMNANGFERGDAAAAMEAEMGEMETYMEEMGTYMEDVDKWSVLQQKIQYYMDDNERIVFRMPYGDTWLDTVIDMPAMAMPTYVYVYPNATIGVRQIYEMIPEFS